MIPSLLTALLAATCLAEPSWKELTREGGVTVWQREIPGSPLVAFKGESTVDSNIAKVASVLRDSARKGEWMDRLVVAKVLKEMGPGERIEYNRTSAPWPLKDREFVFHAKADWDQAAGRITIKMRSVDHPPLPESAQCVRGWMVESTMVLTRLGDGRRTLVSLGVVADPKGFIPKWIVNLFQRHWPRKTLQGLKRQAAKPDVFEDPFVMALPGY